LFKERIMVSVMSVVVSLVLGAGVEDVRASLARGLPPQFGIAVVGEDGNLQIDHVAAAPVYEIRTRTITEMVDGKPVARTETYPVSKFIARRTVAKRDAGQFSVFQNGKQLDVAAAARLLKGPVPVAFQEGLAPLEPFYASLLRPDAIVVCMNPQASEVKNPTAADTAHPTGTPLPAEKTPPPKPPKAAPRAPAAPKAST
jgi:hypothetical protein